MEIVAGTAGMPQLAWIVIGFDFNAEKKYNITPNQPISRFFL